MYPAKLRPKADYRQVLWSPEKYKQHGNIDGRRRCVPFLPAGTLLPYINNIIISQKKISEGAEENKKKKDNFFLGKDNTIFSPVCVLFYSAPSIK